MTIDTLPTPARTERAGAIGADAGPSTPVTEETIRTILAIEDPALRNLWITASYADLAHRLLAVFRTDQSWCTFATWASNTAGASIRGEELPRIIRSLVGPGHDHIEATVDAASRHTPVAVLSGAVGRLQRSSVEQLVADATDDVAGFVAHGNTLVFAELAPLFVRFAELMEDEGAPIDVDAVLEAIGVPAPQDEHLVHLAFRSYATAASCWSDSARAELVLTGNIAAVLHEQQRLQPDLDRALDAGLVDLGTELDAACHRWLPDALRRPLVRAARRRVAPHLDRLWEHVATDLLMTLSLPGETLHLGRDVPPRNGRDLFPPALRRIDLPELDALIDRWDTTGGTGWGSGAADWAVLRDRMGYIVNLFRSRQRDLELTATPFTADQLASMHAGVVPSSL